MAIQYMHLTYEQYKSLERQMKEFDESSHRTEGGFYHKSIRLEVGDLIIEYHGPLVGGYGHQSPEVGLPLTGDLPHKPEGEFTDGG